MTRVDLQLLIIDAIKDVNRYDFGTQSILLTRALWPVLAGVWSSGYIAGHEDCDPDAPGTANPFQSEVPS